MTGVGKKWGKLQFQSFPSGILLQEVREKHLRSPMLARWFRARNIRVGILSRGFGAGIDGRNDEAKELEVLLPDVPHLQKPDRLASAQIATEELGMQLLLLDDGFQHRKIHRDLEIVLLDAREPFGFGHLLPRGLLREPLRSLRRADIVMATRADQVEPQKLAEISNASSTTQSKGSLARVRTQTRSASEFSRRNAGNRMALRKERARYLRFRKSARIHADIAVVWSQSNRDRDFSRPSQLFSARYPVDCQAS